MIENFKDGFLPQREVLGSVQFSQFSFERGRGWVVNIFINCILRMSSSGSSPGWELDFVLCSPSIK